MRIPVLSIPMRYFLEVARLGSVNQAAQQQHVAASAVSRQIGKLEDLMGCALFVRGTRGMALTVAGERLMAHVRSVQEDSDRVLAEVRGEAETALRQVRLACTEGFAGGFMPLVFDRFRDRYPDAQLRLQVAAPDEVSRLVQQGEVDLGLKYVVAPEMGMQVQHGAPAPVFALMLPGHPLARRRSVVMAEVAAYPLAVGPAGLTTRQLLDLCCSLQGLSYRTSMVSNFSGALLASLRGDDILPAGYLTATHRIAEGSLVARPFADAELQQRTLQVLSAAGRNLAPFTQLFLAHLQAAIRSHDARGRKR